VLGRGCIANLGCEGCVGSGIRIVGKGHRCGIRFCSGWGILNVGNGLEVWGNRNSCERDAWHAAFGSCRWHVQVIMRCGKALLVGCVRVGLDAR